jgi:hypothetical protein
VVDGGGAVVVVLVVLDLSVDGVEGAMVEPELGVVVVLVVELELAGGVDGVVVVVDVGLLLSFWQPAAAMAAAMASTAQGFGFIGMILRIGCGPGVRCVIGISRIGAIGCASARPASPPGQLVRRQWDAGDGSFREAAWRCVTMRSTRTRRAPSCKSAW